MMEFIRHWVMSVVAVGMLVSLCLGLSPGGKVQKVGRFCGGLLLFLAVVTPLTRLDLTGSLQEFQDYCNQLAVTSDEFTQASETITQDLVISQSEACIQAQARSLGADVTVSVTCQKPRRALDSRWCLNHWGYDRTAAATADSMDHGCV